MKYITKVNSVFKYLKSLNLNVQWYYTKYWKWYQQKVMQCLPPPKSNKHHHRQQKCCPHHLYQHWKEGRKIWRWICWKYDLFFVEYSFFSDSNSSDKQNTKFVDSTCTSSFLNSFWNFELRHKRTVSWVDMSPESIHSLFVTSLI